MPSAFHALVAATSQALPRSVMGWRRNSSTPEIRTPLLPPSKCLLPPSECPRFPIIVLAGTILYSTPWYKLCCTPPVTRCGCNRPLSAARKNRTPASVRAGPQQRAFPHLPSGRARASRDLMGRTENSNNSTALVELSQRRARPTRLV